MSRKLSEEELRERKLRRQERKREKDMEFKLNERGYQILRILRDAPEHPEVKYNVEYFARLFGVSEPTIYRLLKNMKEHGILEEKMSHGSYVINSNYNEYYYSENERKNIALVASLKGLLQQFEGTPIFESVTKLIYFLQPEVAKEDAVLSSGRVIVPPQMEYDINLRNWNKVYEAIQKNQKIKFRYLKPYTDQKKARIIWPYQLILDNGSVYLFGYDEEPDLVLLYDLNFMGEVIILNDKFELPEHYDFNYYCAGGRLGAFKDDNVQVFKICFTGYAKDWIKKHKWANNQEIIKEADDSTTISFTSAQEEKVFEEVLKWGIQAEPLEPKSLVKHWKNEIKLLYQKISE